MPGEHTPAQTYTWACLHLLPLTHSRLPTHTLHLDAHSETQGSTNKPWAPPLLIFLNYPSGPLSPNPSKVHCLSEAAPAASPFADETLLHSLARCLHAHCIHCDTCSAVPSGVFAVTPTHAFTQSLPVGPSLSRCCQHPCIFWPLVIIPLAHCLPNA